MDNMKRIREASLKHTVTLLFKAVGMCDSDADICADNLITANLWGIDSHGVIRVPLYVERIVRGGINTRPQKRLYEHAQGLAVLDADGSAGAPAGREAMLEAIQRAEKLGIAAVGVRNSNHFGAAGYYSNMAVEAGMIGISMTNVTPLIAAEGSESAIAGNNPISIAVPTYDDIPFLLDMAVSRVANGKLILAEKKNVKIPLDWATDALGNPTDDPVKAQQGHLLPMGDYKGLILAYAVDILCGLITGGAFADGVISMYKHHDLPSQVSHMMIALNLNALLPKETVKSKMQTYRQFLKQQRMRDGSDELLFPGEPEHRSLLERRENGIPVPATTLDEITNLCKKYGVAADL